MITLISEQLFSRVQNFIPSIWLGGDIQLIRTYKTIVLMQSIIRPSFSFDLNSAAKAFLANPMSDLILPTSGDLPGKDQVYAKFETELQVRPDDIDMYQHVHSSRYMDYVLAARFEQMERCYKMPMAEFQKRGYGWFMAATQMNFKRPLGLGNRFIVRTWIEQFTLIGVKVGFQIERLPERKLSCDGWFDYVLVSIETARAVRLPDDIRAQYAI